MSILLSLPRRAAEWTPADYPADVLSFWSGRAATSLAANPDGSGAVVNGTGTGRLADLSSYANPLVQAAAGNKPIAGLNDKGRGFSLSPATGRFLQAASPLAPARHFYAVLAFLGPDSASLGGGLPVAFAGASSAYLTGSGPTDEAHSAIIGLQDTNTIWLPNGAGGLSGPCYVDGVLTTDVGTWWKRRRVRVDRASDLAGNLRALLDGGGVMGTRGWLYEAMALSSLATPQQLADADTWLEWHDATANVVCTCDSLSIGYGLTYHQAVPGLLFNLYGATVNFPCFGVVGQQANQAVLADPPKLASVKGSGRNYVLLEAGANDIANGALAATVVQRLRDYLAMALSNDFQVIVCSIPLGQFWVDTGKTAIVNAVNADLAANWASYGFLDFVDLGSPNTLPDGLHYSALGSSQVAAAAKAVIDNHLP